MRIIADVSDPVLIHIDLYWVKLIYIDPNWSTMIFIETDFGSIPENWSLLISIERHRRLIWHVLRKPSGHPYLWYWYRKISKMTVLVVFRPLITADNVWFLIYTPLIKFSMSISIKMNPIEAKISAISFVLLVLLNNFPTSAKCSPNDCSLLSFLIPFTSFIRLQKAYRNALFFLLLFGNVPLQLMYSLFGESLRSGVCWFILILYTWKNGMNTTHSHYSKQRHSIFSRIDKNLFRSQEFLVGQHVKYMEVKYCPCNLVSINLHDIIKTKFQPNPDLKNKIHPPNLHNGPYVMELPKILPILWTGSRQTWI